MVLELSWHVPRLVHSLSYVVEFSAYSSAVTINCVWYQNVEDESFQGEQTVCRLRSECLKVRNTQNGGLGSWPAVL